MSGLQLISASFVIFISNCVVIIQSSNAFVTSQLSHDAITIRIAASFTNGLGDSPSAKLLSHIALSYKKLMFSAVFLFAARLLRN